MITTDNSTNTTYLILGGARSGKSSYAEKIARESKQDVTYIATANVFDKEMEDRVNQHLDDRPSSWTTIEEPLALADSLKANAKENHIILVDCLTMWMNNLLMLEDSDLFHNEIKKLHDFLPSLPGTIVFVSNEVGMGIVPMGELSRKFVDESGRLHQQLGKTVNNVLFIVAGLALEIKGKKPF